MTIAELRAILEDYPDDAPVFHGNGRTLHTHQVTPDTCEWYTGAKDADGYETPETRIALHIGARF